MNFSTWQGLRSRDPRRLALGTAQWALDPAEANRETNDRAGHGAGEATEDVAHRVRRSQAAEIESLLSIAREAGIRIIATAHSHGRCERILAEAIRHEAGWRVVTKLAPDVHEEGLGLAEVLERVAVSLSSSRQALQTDALPAVLLERFAHRHVCGGRLWRTLLAERDAGRIGTLGISAATPEEAWAALEDPDIEILQVATSLLDLRLHRQGFFPRARELGRTVYVRSIYQQGVAHLEPNRVPKFLSGLTDSMRRIRGLAQELGVPPRALYLAFVRELPGAIAVLSCQSALQLEEVLGDWASEAVTSAQLSPLLVELPELPEDLVDPARWPPRSGQRDSLNQTPAASIATMPA
jgi:aryl-alcohol dehydrogenase-like predicted oxidoreductase